jgi:hypothetical protein
MGGRIVAARSILLDHCQWAGQAVSIMDTARGLKMVRLLGDGEHRPVGVGGQRSAAQ